MQPETPTSKPRRGRHFGRWLLLGILATFGWFGWKAYDFHLAKQEAKALGWGFENDGPIEKIRRDWGAAFRIEAWSESKREVTVFRDNEFPRRSALLKRIAPNSVQIFYVSSLKDLSELEALSNLSDLGIAESKYLTNIDAIGKMKGLKKLFISGIPQLTNIDALKDLQNLRYFHLLQCKALTNVDALRELKSLESLWLSGCTGLKNVDGLLGLTQLKILDLSGCTALPREAVDAVKAALPKTDIITPDGKTVAPRQK
jgi:hypothetical protein